MKYQATTEGHIIGPSGNLLTELTDKWGYKTVKLGGARRFVHRLVLMYFSPVDGCERLQVNHKNEVKTDNRPENLEWCTNGYNQRYGTRIERIVAVRNQPVIAYDDKGNEFGRFKSATEAAKTHGWCQSNIWAALNGERATAYGLRWEKAPRGRQISSGATPDNHTP